jgi:hypothetical protein
MRGRIALDDISRCCPTEQPLDVSECAVGHDLCAAVGDAVDQCDDFSFAYVFNRSRAPKRQHFTPHDTLDLAPRPIPRLVSPEPFIDHGRDESCWVGATFCGLTLNERVAPTPHQGEVFDSLIARRLRRPRRAVLTD